MALAAGSAATADDLVRPVATPRLGDERCRRRVLGRPHDRDLERRARAPGPSPQPLREPGRVAGHVRHDRPDRALGRIAVRALAGPRREPEQDARRHRVPRRDRVVLDVLRSGDQPLVVVGRVEEAAGRVARTAPGSRPPGRARSRTSARRRSPRTARAGHRRDARSPRARPARPPGRPSTIGRASRRPPSRPPTIVAGRPLGGARYRAARSGRSAPARTAPRRRRPRSPARSRPRAPCRRAPAAAARPGARAAAPEPPPAASTTSAVGQPEPRRRAPRRRPTRDRIVTPSQLPSSVTPYAASNSAAVVAEHVADLGRRAR